MEKEGRAQHYSNISHLSWKAIVLRTEFDNAAPQITRM